MGVSIISFTERGMHLAEEIADCLKEEESALFIKGSWTKECAAACFILPKEQSVGEWAGEQMRAGHALVFVGACGIAVRAIAPYITDKLHDSPVLVADESGRYVIPILSGHVGGANELAERIAPGIGAAAVITTATDLRGKFAADLFAKRNGLHIVNREGIAKVSSKVLAGERITVAVEVGHLAPDTEIPEEVEVIPCIPEYPVDVAVTAEKKGNAMLYLAPREYVLGMGCKRGKEAEKVEDFIQKSMAGAGISREEIFALASLDIKKEEPGLLAWSRKAGIPILTFSAEQLRELAGDFHGSAFVEARTGVDNVCERAALKACGLGGVLISPKYAEDGMTIAIAKREWSVRFDET